MYYLPKWEENRSEKKHVDYHHIVLAPMYYVQKKSKSQNNPTVFVIYWISSFPSLKYFCTKAELTEYIIRNICGYFYLLYFPKIWTKWLINTRCPKRCGIGKTVELWVYIFQKWGGESTVIKVLLVEVSILRNVQWAMSMI